MYMSSNCKTDSHRDDFVNIFSQYLDVDSVGKCLRNKDFPLRLQHLQANDDLWKVRFGGTSNLLELYKFRLLIISTIFDDYFVEKLCQTLSAGAIPIYLGMPNGHLWDPGIVAGVHPAMIHVSDFESMADLADYIHYLSLDTDEARSARYKYFEFVNHIPEKDKPWYPQHIADFSAKTGNDSWESFVCLKTWIGDVDHVAHVQAPPRGDWRTFFKSMGKNLSLWV